MDVSPSSSHKRKRTKYRGDVSKRKKIEGQINIDEEKERLEKLVLSDASGFLERISERVNVDSGLEDEDDDRESTTQFSDTLASPPREPAWHDDSDVNNISKEEAFLDYGGKLEDITGSTAGHYQEVLRKRFKTVFGEPAWAKLPHRKTNISSDDEDEHEILATAGRFIKKSEQLPMNILHTKQVASLNGSTRTEGPFVNVIEFHSKSPVALVAGSSGVASIFQVDGSANSKISSLQFDKFNIKCAKFTTDGNKFIVGSNLFSHFYVYDLIQEKHMKIPIHRSTEITNMKSFEVSPDGHVIAVKGRFGYIHLLASGSYELIEHLKVNGEVTSLSFSSDGSLLYALTDFGEVNCWDMKRRTLTYKFFDEGCLAGTCITVSPNDALIACGSSSGVVNVYSTSSVSKKVNPTPLRALMNLTTSCSFVKFDSTSQILAFASQDKNNSIKLCHTPSMTVFCNFPNSNHSFNKVVCAAFSPKSGFLSIGNNRSTAYLFRLKHFGNY